MTIVVNLLLLNMTDLVLVTVVDSNVESELIPVPILVALILCDVSSAPASNETTINRVVISDQGMSEKGLALKRYSAVPEFLLNSEIAPRFTEIPLVGAVSLVDECLHIPGLPVVEVLELEHRVVKTIKERISIRWGGSEIEPGLNVPIFVAVDATSFGKRNGEVSNAVIMEELLSIEVADVPVVKHGH